MPLCGVDLHLSALLLMGQRRLHCYVAIDYPHVGWWSSAGVKTTQGIRVQLATMINQSTIVINVNYLYHLLIKMPICT